MPEQFPSELLELISQDQLARRIVLLLGCPPSGDGLTSTQIGTNLERGKERDRGVILQRLGRLADAGVIEHFMPGPLGPRMYRLTSDKGQKLAKWLYRDMLRRQDQVDAWESKWDEVLETQDKGKIEKVKTEIIDDLLSFLYYA
jgi:hypothetical protein